MISLKDLGCLYRKEQDLLASESRVLLKKTLSEVNAKFDFDRLASLAEDEDLFTFVDKEFPANAKLPVRVQKMNLLEEARRNVHNDGTNSDRMQSDFFSAMKNQAAKPKIALTTQGSIVADPTIPSPMERNTVAKKNTILVKGKTMAEGNELRTLNQTIQKKSTIQFNMEGEKMINQYKFLRELGKGAFGKVELAVDQETEEHFAIKVQSKKLMKKKALTVSKESFNMLQKEIAIMKKIVRAGQQMHPNLIGLYEVIEDDEEEMLYLIMDFMDIGYLGCARHKSELKLKEKNIPEIHLWSFFRACLSGLDYRTLR